MTLRRVRRTILILSMLMFPITFIDLSPNLAVDGLAHGVIACGLIVWIAIFLASLFVGRGFCSYLCPGGGMQFCLDAALHKPLVRVPLLRAAKYLLCAAWVGSMGWLAVTSSGPFRLDAGYKNPGFPPYAPLAHAIWLGVTALIVATALLLGKRAYCQYVCLFAPLQIVGAWIGRTLRLPRLHVEVLAPASCKACRTCNAQCPMSLDAAKMVADKRIQDPECIVCGNCAAACSSGVLRYGFSRGTGKHESTAVNSQRQT